MTENEPVCVKDFFRYAEKNIRPDLLTYCQSGATNEITLAENEKSFTRYLFLPRMLRDVSKRTMSTTLLGANTLHPFGLAPTASHKIAHPDGEIASALAASTTGTPMILSTLSSVRLEDVAAVYLKNWNQRSPKVPLWFQLYIFKNRLLTKSLIDRAEASGYTALVITIDNPISGIRYQNLRDRHVFHDISYANLIDQLIFYSNVAENFDDSLTWSSMMEFLRSNTTLPIIVKGVLTVDDARLAIEHGVDGIIVSNHGARQLDSVPPTIDCLKRIAEMVPSSFELYMDGGVRSGNDIMKAIALGAKCVFIGRPVLWSLSYGGSNGVVKLINILRRELDVCMALNGIKDIKDVPADLVVRASE